jgi:hypothetical protein
MVQETSGSKDWLESLVIAAHGKKLKEALDALSCMVRQSHGTRIWFVKLLGRRWSYLAGEVNPEPSSSTVERIRLNSRIGLVSDNWEALSSSKGTELLIFLRWLVAVRTEKEACVD